LDSTTENQKARLLHEVVTKWQQGAILFLTKKKKHIPKKSENQANGSILSGRVKRQQESLNPQPST